MSDNIWKLLQIEPTRDQAQIKKAYAVQSRIYHPEENPQEFMRLRKAYQLAMEWAEEAEEDVFAEKAENDAFAEEVQEIPQLGDQSLQREERATQELVPHFVFHREPGGPNPYRESEAYQAFLKLYKKENQKNWKLWTEYITSPEFLSVSLEEEFCALMEETVQDQQSEFRPGQEFIKSLYTAYCFTAINTGGYGEDELQFRQEQNACTVPEPIFAIVRSCPVPRRLTGNDYTMRMAFSNYYHLWALAQEAGRTDQSWTDQSMRSLRQILDRYVPAYIKDSYNGGAMPEHARHPLGLRLLNYFFETAELNRECYQTAWETLGLKQAVLGRDKLLYGRLREICLEKCPDLDEEEPGSFLELNKLYGTFVERAYDPEQEEAEVKSFFAREDLKKALCNRRYVETIVLTDWIGFRRSAVFLRYLRAFYEGNRTAPCAGEALKAIERAEEYRRIYRQNNEDTEAPASIELAGVSYRPFLRYFLNIAFRDFLDLEQYLKRQLPNSPEWAERLFGLENAKEITPIRRSIMLDGAEIEVLLHLYYVEYRVNGQEMFRPFVSYEKAASLETEELLLLLPAAYATGGRVQDAGVSMEYKRQLTQELQERLAETALPSENRAEVAKRIGDVLLDRFGEMKRAEDRGIALPLTIYRETRDALYCAKWRPEEGRMSLYVEEGSSGMICHSTQTYDFLDHDLQAAARGIELLEQMIAPAAIDLSCMEKLPETVYVSGPSASESILENEAITKEVLGGLLEQFARGELNRLEFSFTPNRWELKAEEVETYARKRSLVFLKQNQEYSCFYFDDTKYLFYAFMKRSGSIGEVGYEYISLSHKNLPRQCIFDAFDSIWCNLELILDMASRAEAFKRSEGVPFRNDCAWRDAWGGVFIQNRRVKYNLAKQELGKFPLERAYNSERQPMLLDQEQGILNRQPLELEQRTRDGAVNIIRIDGIKKPLFTEAMKHFFMGDVIWLRLSWDVSPEEYRTYFAPGIFADILARRTGEPMQSHLVLRRDGDRYTLLCLQDLGEKAEYSVADMRTYMNVENKYPKEDFLGKVLPAYLIHKDPVFLRNRLDLLLDHMECLLPVTRRFAEFAGEKPGKARDYAAIRAEFVPC